MKKLIIFLLSLALFCVYLSAEVVYRRGVIDDLEALFTLQERFTFDDQKRLLLLPPEIRTAGIKKKLEKHRIFVAIDDDTGQIIGFNCTFLITEADERGEILYHELRMKSDDQKGECVEKGAYNFERDNVGDYKSALKLNPLDVTQSGHNELLQMCYGSSFCTYIYTGGTYVMDKYRAFHVASNLFAFALDQIKDQIARHHRDVHTKYLLDPFDRVGGAYLAVVYGRVDANVSQTRLIRPFASFAQNLHNRLFGYKYHEFDLYYFGFRAYKPVIVFDKDKGVVVQPDQPQNVGRGNILIYRG